MIASCLRRFNFSSKFFILPHIVARLTGHFFTRFKIMSLSIYDCVEHVVQNIKYYSCSFLINSQVWFVFYLVMHHINKSKYLSLF